MKKLIALLFAGFVATAAVAQEAPDVLVQRVTEEVLEGPQSVIFDQAENKMHIHAAILEHFILGAYK